MACGNESGACEEEEDACVCVCIQGSPLTLCLRRCLAPFSPLPSLPASLSLPPSHPSIWPAQLSLPAQAIPQAETAAFSLHSIRKNRVALDSGHVLGGQKGMYSYTVPNVSSLSCSPPPSQDFCSLVSTSSPGDCTKGKLINANNNKTQMPTEPQSLPGYWVGYPHPRLGTCPRHTCAHEARHESNPPTGREGKCPRWGAGSRQDPRGEPRLSSMRVEGLGRRYPDPPGGMLHTCSPPLRQQRAEPSIPNQEDAGERGGEHTRHPFPCGNGLHEPGVP